MTPGEVMPMEGYITINKNRESLKLTVANTGDRPIQVGSHYHFYEVNQALTFERALSRGCHLNVAAGTAVRFEPGQSRSVELVKYAGKRAVYGFQQKIMGPLESGFESEKERS